MRTLLLLAVAAPLAAAPVPKDFRAKEPFFPTVVGTKWEYAIEGTDTLDHIREVTSREREKDNSCTFEETWTAAAGVYGKYHTCRANTAGLAELRSGRGQWFELPHLKFKADAPPGDTWDAGVGSTKPGEKPWFTGTREAGEAVTTPAGKFRAIKVVLRNGRGEVDAYWYAPGVGLVKLRTDNGKTIVLSKFTPGKEAK